MLKNYGGVMTTKCTSFSELENLQSFKKSKGQDNIDELRFSKFSEIRIKKCNLVKFQSSKKAINLVTARLVFSTGSYNISSQNNYDNRTIITSSGGELIGSILIKDYFQEHPTKRKALAKNVAKYITSTDTVLEVLDLGTSRKIREGFDATVMLLAECGNVILSTLNHLSKPSPDNKDLLVLEEKWEILITSMACSSNIPAQKRFDAIVKLIPDSKRRSVKTAIIDALLIMEDEIDIESIKGQLEYFLSDSEHDEYVKEYAKEAMEDM
ncbi:hypothetical protein [Anabaena catenula]|uniref:Uncharacterized protein n=1 Tax=Anabaena catenula FACHB-362 TaxID=2692877 RepID=A0ABR8J3T4_9NOST|nr:hypothetical protein [Anabaena catenula]MBD2692283.1 hypothetical protein [Anabaena catenula FACHB-362]